MCHSFILLSLWSRVENRFVTLLPHRCSNSWQTWRSRGRTAGRTNTALGSRTSTPSCMRLAVSPLHLFTDLALFYKSGVSNVPTVYLCTSTQTLKYLSKTPCSRQSPETVKEFLTTMMPHKLTKSVWLHMSIDAMSHKMYRIYSPVLQTIVFIDIFPLHQGRKTTTVEPSTTDSSGNSASECHKLLLLNITFPSFVSCSLLVYL